MYSIYSEIVDLLLIGITLVLLWSSQQRKTRAH